MWDVTKELFKLLSTFTLWFSSRKSGDYICSVVSIYDAMHKVINKTGVKRFLILKIHNGGGNITAANELYVSVLYEDYRAPFISRKDTYQKLLLDKEYIRFINEVYLNKKIVMDVNSMNDGLLKQIYANEGVKYSEAYFLHQNKKFFYFLTVATDEEPTSITSSSQQGEIILAVNMIRNSLKK